MMQKNSLFILLGALLVWGAPLSADNENLISNPSFEQYKTSTTILGSQTEFTDWTLSAIGASADETDKVDGKVALHWQPTTKNATLDQGILLDSYEAGDLFTLTVHYKVKNPNGGVVKLDCYWVPKPGYDEQKMKLHEADKLQVELTDAATDGWVEHQVVTSMPENGRYFRVRLIVTAKNADVLFDQFSLVKSGHQNPGDPDEPGGGDQPDQPDTWAQTFNWDMSNPRVLLVEEFNFVQHNKPIHREGWQNVAPADARPWWGFDESTLSYIEGENKYAKATAYQFATESTGTWEMWLVTPALDYKNAASKLFAFSVMGEYLPKEGNQASFEIYYIDATRPGEEVFFQNLTESFEIPTTSDDNLVWRTFYLDLAPYSATMADVFFMAFRYASPNGNEGVVTYYVDDVSWGRNDLQAIQSQQSSDSHQKILRNGQLYLMYEGTMYDVQGKVIGKR